MHDDSTPLCRCGCGLPAPIARQTVNALGQKKGDVLPYRQGHARKYVATHEVDETTGCWVWKGAKSTGGYGMLSMKGTWSYAHRLYYERANGPIPDGLQIDHLCRNRLCVNPDHLEAVSQRENVARGIGCRLTDEQVAEMRQRRATTSCKQLAREYGVSPSYVSRVTRHQKRLTS